MRWSFVDAAPVRGLGEGRAGKTHEMKDELAGLVGSVDRFGTLVRSRLAAD